MNTHRLMNTRQLVKQTTLLMCGALLTSSALLRAQPGALDPTFGVDGVATTPNTSTRCGGVVNCAVAIQSDGKIVVAGQAAGPRGEPELALARYKAPSLQTMADRHLESPFRGTERL
jgi:hypothetical protein